MVELLTLYVILAVFGIITHAIVWLQYEEGEFWNIMGLIIVWPLWLAIKIVKGIFRGLKNTIMS